MIKRYLFLGIYRPLLHVLEIEYEQIFIIGYEETLYGKDEGRDYHGV